jgi:phage terminase large subunit GpA-like protein
LRKGIATAAFTIFRPPPTLTVSQWADDNRRLPATSAEPGKWRTSRVPYTKRIMDVLGDDVTREVVFAKSAQTAGTSIGENYIGYVIDQSPSAILTVWPTEKALRAWSTKRLSTLISDSPCLREKFPKSARRDSKDSIASKEFPGGYIQALTAKSTADLRSHSARRAVAEEVDEWEGDVKDQGDPLQLLRRRMITFWNSKFYMVSTPTIAGFSRIWKELESSTWEEFWVPCPHCGHFQTLRWKDGDQDKYEAGQYRLVWEKDDSGQMIPGTCCYVCESCAAYIEERHKSPMLEKGEWRARFPGREKVGFHINTLYSPLCSWDEIARSFESAVKNPSEMKTFVNTMLGLPYEESGEKVDANVLMNQDRGVSRERPARRRSTHRRRRHPGRSHRGDRLRLRPERTELADRRRATRRGSGTRRGLARARSIPALGMEARIRCGGPDLRGLRRRRLPDRSRDELLRSARVAKDHRDGRPRRPRPQAHSGARSEEVQEARKRKETAPRGGSRLR